MNDPRSPPARPAPMVLDAVETVEAGGEQLLAFLLD